MTSIIPPPAAGGGALATCVSSESRLPSEVLMDSKGVQFDEMLIVTVIRGVLFQIKCPF